MYLSLSYECGLDRINVIFRSTNKRMCIRSQFPTSFITFGVWFNVVLFYLQFSTVLISWFNYLYRWLYILFLCIDHYLVTKVILSMFLPYGAAFFMSSGLSTCHLFWNLNKPSEHKTKQSPNCFLSCSCINSMHSQQLFII